MHEGVPASHSSRVAIDVGGTFTDVVDLSPAGELRFDKVPTTPAAPAAGVLHALAVTPADLARVSMFTHGTTLAVNALLTRSGARTAVIGTLGFRDVYLLGRTDRRVNYDITYRPPAALLERYDTFEVPERSRFDGTVHRPLDEAAARAVAGTVAARGYESVAVAFLHSYANPGHELRMREILAEEAPGVAVSLSHELSREYREYERTSTAVLDAYVKPVVRRYLEVLEQELAAAGFTGRFLVTRSAGGAMTAASARDQPVSLILSGPAGGVVGAAAFGRLIGEPNLITIDMGGTSLDASLVVAGEPVLHQRAEFEQYPINTPSLYIHTIGAGGGSIAWLDEAGALQVGPRSAGAEPGPASYGHGGTAPTFTDAALAVGYLGTATPLGGRLRLEAKLATAALEPVAGQLGLSPQALARGIVGIATTKITGAVRSITVEVGRDPMDFALLSFGGGGGLVAADVAHELGIPTVIVPPGPGAFSALGMLMADVQHDFSRTYVCPLAGLDRALLDQVYGEMITEARRVLAAEGFSPGDQVLALSIDVRYTGQEHTVTVALGRSSDAADITASIERDFTDQHDRQYGHTMTDPVEAVAMRLRATGVVSKPAWPLLRACGGRPPEADGGRAVYLSDETDDVGYRLFTRERLLAGHEIDGPAIVSEHTATTVIHAGDHLRVGPHGELVITTGAGREG